MKTIKTFTIGSSRFFSGIPGYKGKDLDELHVMDEFPEGDNVLHLFSGERDIILVRKLTKEGYIKDVYDSKVPMRAGKFLSKEFAEWIGFTLDDLKTLEPVFRHMDDKHQYEEIIYDAYLENGGWWLTPEQTEKAYASYKKHRFL